MKRIIVLQLLLLSASSLTRPRISGWEAGGFIFPNSPHQGPCKSWLKWTLNIPTPTPASPAEFTLFLLPIKWKVCDFFFKDIYYSIEFNHTASFHKTKSSLEGLVAVNCDDAAHSAGGSQPWTVPGRQVHVKRRGEAVLKGPEWEYYPSPSKYTITQKGERGGLGGLYSKLSTASTHSNYRDCLEYTLA